MRALLFHAKEYGVEFDSFANRPKGIIPEEVKGKEKQECKDCIVAFITIEQGDKDETSTGISEEICKMCMEVKRDRAVIVPFAHLSNNLGDPKISLNILKSIEKKLKEKKIKVMGTHFGSNKSLHLDVYGHVGNARYREF
jgi:threonyl-tRNA synthetase